MVLSTLRQGWQQQPSSNTKCGKPRTAQHPRPDCGMNHRSWHAPCNGFLIGLTTRDQEKFRVCLLPNSPVLSRPCADYSSPD